MNLHVVLSTLYLLCETSILCFCSVLFFFLRKATVDETFKWIKNTCTLYNLNYKQTRVQFSLCIWSTVPISKEHWNKTWLHDGKNSYFSIHDRPQTVEVTNSLLNWASTRLWIREYKKCSVWLLGYILKERCPSSQFPARQKARACIDNLQHKILLKRVD